MTNCYWNCQPDLAFVMGFSLPLFLSNFVVDILVEIELSFTFFQDFIWQEINLLTYDMQTEMFCLVKMLAKCSLLTPLSNYASMVGVHFSPYKCKLLLQD